MKMRNVFDQKLFFLLFFFDKKEEVDEGSNVYSFSIDVLHISSFVIIVIAERQIETMEVTA